MSDCGDLVDSDNEKEVEDALHKSGRDEGRNR
jgi:hypothetical protein